MKLSSHGLDEMVILDLARQTVLAFHVLRLHPHHANLTFELLFQMLSIRIMSWDFERADQLFAWRKNGIRNAVETTAAEVLGQTLDGVRYFGAE